MNNTADLRAMREAKYARSAAARGATRPTPSGTTPAAPTAPTAPAPVAPKKAAPAAAEPAPATDALCGHRNMSGRTCTREQGHAAKSHRYS